MEIIKKYNLIWLASYPKSGNTWLRIFLTTLLSNDSYLDLNHLKFSEIYSDASFFKKFYKKDITNFSPEALEKARANLLYFFAQTHEGHLFIKTTPLNLLKLPIGFNSLLK